MDVQEGMGVEALDFVDSWLQLSILENSSGATSRVERHR